jgi:hypothetical protein
MDQVWDTLQERERKWDVEVEELAAATVERDGDARVARPKERLRWLARKEEVTLPPVESVRRTAMLERASPPPPAATPRGSPPLAHVAPLPALLTHMPLSRLATAATSQKTLWFRWSVRPILREADRRIVVKEG